MELNPDQIDLLEKARYANDYIEPEREIEKDIFKELDELGYFTSEFDLRNQKRYKLNEAGLAAIELVSPLAGAISAWVVSSYYADERGGSETVWRYFQSLESAMEALKKRMPNMTWSWEMLSPNKYRQYHSGNYGSIFIKRIDVIK